MVGDCENLPYKDNFFNLVYSFHSTWYFPDLIKTISEMIRVTMPGGLVVFDIQNVNNKANSKSNRKRIRKYNYRYFFYPFHFFKQIVKIILHRTDISWEISLHEIPTDPQILTKYFEEREVQYEILIRNEDESLSLANNSDSWMMISRLVFLVHVK